MKILSTCSTELWQGIGGVKFCYSALSGELQDVTALPLVSVIC